MVGAGGIFPQARWRHHREAAHLSACCLLHQQYHRRSHHCHLYGIINQQQTVVKLLIRGINQNDDSSERERKVCICRQLFAKVVESLALRIKEDQSSSISSLFKPFSVHSNYRQHIVLSICNSVNFHIWCNFPLAFSSKQFYTWICLETRLPYIQVEIFQRTWETTRREGSKRKVTISLQLV